MHLSKLASTQLAGKNIKYLAVTAAAIAILSSTLTVIECAVLLSAQEDGDEYNRSVIIIVSLSNVLLSIGLSITILGLFFEASVIFSDTFVAKYGLFGATFIPWTQVTSVTIQYQRGGRIVVITGRHSSIKVMPSWYDGSNRILEQIRRHIPSDIIEAI